MEETVNDETKEVEEALLKRKKIKRNVAILWILFVIALVATVALWFAMRNAKPEFKEVEAVVISAQTNRVTVKGEYGSKSSTDFYDVKVEYDGKTYDLKNAHNTYSYPEGKTVKAYLSNGKLYANKEGVQTSTPIATVYFVFLFGTFGLLFGASVYSGKLAENKKKVKE